MGYRAFERIARASQRFEARYTPLGRLLGTLTIAAAIFATDPSRTTANLLLAALFALFVVSFALSVRWGPALTVTRRFPARTVAGISTSYDLVIRNDGDRAQRDLRLRDRLSEDFPCAADLAAGPHPGIDADNWFDTWMGFRRWLRALHLKRGAELSAATLDELPVGATAAVAVTLVPQRRGVIEFAHVDVQRADPLGLRYATRRFSAPQRLLVLPRHFTIANLGEIGTGQALPATTPQPGSLAGGTEFHALREYRAGDARRHIHWRASARRGVHVVKQFVDGYREALRLLLDPCAEASLFESVIEVAASLVVAASRQSRDGLALEWLELSGVPGSTVASCEPTRLLEALALRAPANVDTFEQTVRRRYFAPHETVIFITGHWDPVRQAFNRRLASTLTATRTIIVVDDLAAPTNADPQCTVMRPSRLAHGLRHFTLARGSPR